MPCEAFIEIEGNLIQADDNPYPNDPNVRVGFVNNGIMALFESARYLIDGKEIESIDREVDVATTIIGLARYSDDYTRSAGPSMMFAKDINNHADHITHTRVKATRDTAADPALDGYNCNILAVFNGVDTHTLRNIWQTWCSYMEFSQFKNFFSNAQSTPHGFITINLHDPRTRYRIGLDQIFG